MNKTFTPHDLPVEKRPLDKAIKQRKIRKICSICGKNMSVILFPNRAYSGGHYFGKIPKVSKPEMNKALKAGTTPVRIGIHTLQVLNHDPKPYELFEYWECKGCCLESRSSSSTENLQCSLSE